MRLTSWMCYGITLIGREVSVSLHGASKIMQQIPSKSTQALEIAHMPEVCNCHDLMADLCDGLWTTHNKCRLIACSLKLTTRCPLKVFPGSTRSRHPIIPLVFQVINSTAFWQGGSGAPSRRYRLPISLNCIIPKIINTPHSCNFVLLNNSGFVLFYNSLESIPDLRFEYSNWGESREYAFCWGKSSNSLR